MPSIIHMDKLPKHRFSNGVWSICGRKYVRITDHPGSVTCRTCKKMMERNDPPKPKKPGCECKDWQENISKVNGPITLQAVRTGGRGYTGKQFVYCPWCAKKLPKTK